MNWVPEAPKLLRGAGIAGTGSYVPARVLTNFDLEKMVDTSDEWIRERTGIRERHIAAPEETTSDLAQKAASSAIEDAGLSAADIDMIVVATITPDMPFPSAACMLQSKIGAARAFCFDISAGCTGFVYALEIGSQFVKSGRCENVLVVGAETLSRVTDWTHRNTCVLFGDGAGAVVLRPLESEDDGVLGSVLFSDGTAGDILTLPAGGSKLPASHETVDGRLHFIHMEGNRVYRFAVRVMAEAAEACLTRFGLGPQDIDLFIPHQANKRLVDIAAERLGLVDKSYVNVDKYGNTSAASIPLAMDEAVRAGKIKDGDLVMLVGFGAGLTWGASLIKWCKGRFAR